MTKKIEAMGLREVKEVKMVTKEESCNFCDIMGHSTSDCPNIPIFKEMFHDQANSINTFKKPFPSPYSDTYNPQWRNHPNFSWKEDKPAHAPQPPKPATNFSFQPSRLKTLEDTLHAFMESQTESNNQTSQDIKEIKNALATLTASLRTQEKGKFPAQPQPNPSTQSFASCSTEIQQENASSITTLRSGKAVDKSIPSKEKEPSLPPMSNGKDEGKSESVDKLDKEKDVQYAPFLQRLQPTKNINQNAEIFERHVYS